MSERTASFHVKATSQKNFEIRRFHVKSSDYDGQERGPFSVLMENVSKIFGQDVKYVTYTDEDGDDIMLGSDSELLEAIESNDKQVLRMKVYHSDSVVSKDAIEELPTSDETSQDEVVEERLSKVLEKMKIYFSDSKDDLTEMPPQEDEEIDSADCESGEIDTAVCESSCSALLHPREVRAKKPIRKGRAMEPLREERARVTKQEKLDKRLLRVQSEISRIESNKATTDRMIAKSEAKGNEKSCSKLLRIKASQERKLGVLAEREKDISFLLSSADFSQPPMRSEGGRRKQKGGRRNREEEVKVQLARVQEAKERVENAQQDMRKMAEGVEEKLSSSEGNKPNLQNRLRCLERKQQALETRHHKLCEKEKRLVAILGASSSPVPAKKVELTD